MQTITLGKARYTVHEHRTDFMSQLLKITGKPKRTKLTPEKRYFPKTGESMSTSEYVHAYYKLNRLGEPEAVDQLFGPMTKHITLHIGQDTMETLP
ncbi:hypothetical protein UFOVP125_39 [uncultured Caudovirales phage]|jgi:hypothetical protein|uniref:Uncharacterized protein n=1 Tax=uncultured Caudovirales phage TaxID=2100421 RepID=A0A6J5LJM5_9CAUD|nr:hypothetical protein UFOVP125_39 [uncultured Caudovirales phage]